MVPSHDNIAEVTLDDEVPAECCMSNSIREHLIPDNTLSMQDYVKSDELMSSPNKGFSIISYVTASMLQQTLGI